MRKVFEIKVTSSASFYSYLALSGIDFKTKEKPEIIIFTCDMTDAEFAAAVQYCNKLAEERKFNESVEKYKKLHEEYITIQQVKEALDDLFHDISCQVLYKQKEAERELAEICVKTKLATTSSTGGLLLALQRAIVTARPKGRYRKHFCWPAIKRYYSNLLVSILLLALLYTFELLHLLYCQSFQHNIL